MNIVNNFFQATMQHIKINIFERKFNDTLIRIGNYEDHDRIDQVR